jgi:FkbM family methyltransferase
MKFFYQKIWWRLKIFLSRDFYKGGIYSIIFLIPLSIRTKYPKHLSLSGFLARKVKSISIERKNNNYLIRCPKLIFEVPFMSDDFFDILYPFLEVKNDKIEKILNNPFYVEGRYLTENCSLAAGDNVIDAGANIGFFSILAANLVGDYGQVFSFEPVAEANAILKNNIKLNNCRNIEVIEKALGETEGEAQFYIDGDGLFEGSSFVIKPQNNAGEGRRIMQTTVDEFVFGRNLDRVDFIKVDIEGAERYMLKGAEKTIKKFKPKIAIRIYHLPDDPEVIEEILKSFVPEYKIDRFYDKTIYAYV